MKFSCNSNTLQKNITIVEKAVSQKSSIPILDNIFIELKDGALKLRGNDLEIGIENVCSLASIEREGQVLIKAKTLSSILSKMQDQDLQFEVDDRSKLNIHGPKIDFEILGTNASEYPEFPTVSDGTVFTISVENLKQLIKNTIFSVSFDESKQFLNGILIKKEGNELLFVSTDGYRLSMKRHPVDVETDDFSVIAPYKAVNELHKILQTKEDSVSVTMIVSENQIAFKMDDFQLISRVIKGQFPDYKQVIPKESQHSYVIQRRLLQIAAERASVIASASNNVVRLSFQENKVIVRSNASALGEFKEEVAVDCVSGEGECRLAFNVKLLLEAVKIIETDDICISFNTEVSPCKFEPMEDDTTLFIIMPIRTSEYQDS